jgi:beta-exotoxin I transport system permease protein
MLHSLLGKTVYDARRGLLGWSVGLLATVGMLMLMYPTVQTGDYGQVVQQSPEALLRAFGMDRGVDVASATGYLGGYLFGFMLPVLLLVYAIGAGATALAGEEEHGTLDLLAAHPISRRRLAVEKFTGFLAVTLLLGTVVVAGVLAAAPAVGLHVPVAGLLAAVTSQVLLAVLFGALALAVGAATGSRGLAAGAGAAAAGGAYLVNALAPLSDTLQPMQGLSPLYWATGNNPIVNGFGPGLLVIAAATLALVAAAATLFARRDLTS